MKMSTAKLNETWYVDSSASNRMKNHEEWFSHLEKPEQLGVVETGDNTSHPIGHIGNVPPCCPEREVEESLASPEDPQESGVS